MDLKAFNNKRETILEEYEKLKKTSIEMDNKELYKGLEESRICLKEDHFNLVVVGEFSRGKSTFINAILGDTILPASTKPTTAIINKISYETRPNYKLYFRDGSESKDICETEFKDIVAGNDPDFDDESDIERYNKNVEFISSIAYAHIKYPTDLCKGGIEIIDTPGTNDLDQAREEITFKFIPQSDAAIFLLSANQILSQSEVSFLKEHILNNDIQKVFFVINFKDRLLNEEAEKKVLEYAREHLSCIVTDPKIFMISSKNALNYKRVSRGEKIKGTIPATLEETGIVLLEQELGIFLMKERANIKLGKYIDRGIKIADELIKNNINIQISTLGISSQELAVKVNAYKPKVLEIKDVAHQTCHKLHTSLINIENDLVFQYRSGLETICVAANSVVNRYIGDLEIEMIVRAIEHEVAPLHVNLQQTLEDFKQKYVERAIDKAMSVLKTIWEDININFTNELMVIEQPKEHKLEINEVSEKVSNEINIMQGLMVGGTFIAMFSMPLIVIPAAIFGGKYFVNLLGTKKRENFLTEVKLQVDRRYGEIIPRQVALFKEKYRENINTITTQLENQIQGKIKGFEEQLNHLLEDKRRVEVDEKREYERLTYLTREIEDIKRKLKEVME